MKNENIFPLERNNYFFGKLMTEREYCTEQSYFNNKRRLFNATLLSSGIVCGFTVTRVDGATIAIESGLAFDGLGRELAVPQIIVTQLSKLGGFANDRGLAPYVYLCAEYNETQTAPVRSVGSGIGAEQFGYVQENVRMFLRYGEPERFEIVRPSKEGYHKMSLENILEQGAQELLYLARIHLVRWEEAYEIGTIEQAPFNQYAELLTSATAQQTLTEPDIKEVEKTERHNPYHSHSDDTRPLPFISFGTAEVRITEGARPGTIYYSDEISHNLGLVPANITVGIIYEDSTIFGDCGIFRESLYFDYAVRVFNDSGTFRIGVRTNVRSDGETIKFSWSAITDPARVNAEVPARIIINPSVLRMRPLETSRITAELYGLPNTAINWSVKERNGGDITSDGFYTAPVEAGVYTVTAQVADTFGKAFVVVK